MEFPCFLGLTKKQVQILKNTGKALIPVKIFFHVKKGINGVMLRLVNKVDSIIKFNQGGRLMPNTQFPYDGKLTGSDLSALLLGEDFGNKVNLDIHRDVSLSWDIVTGSSSNSNGKSGDKCYQLQTTNYELRWTAQITETVTKTTRPIPIIHDLGDVVSGIGKVITGAGTTLLAWSGIAALTPAAPAAPVSAVGAGVITGVGAVVTGGGELLKWLTDGTVTGWTTQYTESGTASFQHTTYTEVECNPEQEYAQIEVPDPVPTLELLKSEKVAEVGNDLASSGNLHPPKQ